MTGNGDIDAHRATYEGMISLLKWGALSCLVIVFFVLWLLRG